MSRRSGPPPATPSSAPPPSSPAPSAAPRAPPPPFNAGNFAGAAIPVSANVVRLKPFQYIHVHDNNTTVTRLLVGPQTYTRQDHEVFVQPSPLTVIVVPPEHYCVVADPVVRDARGEVALDARGQAKLRLGALEIRAAGPPFPLFPGERIEREVQRLRIVRPLQAIKCSALSALTDDTGKARRAGDEWLVYGPCSYIPRVDVADLELIEATTIRANEALQLRARVDFVDDNGTPRRAGQMWQRTEAGAYLPRIEEEVVELVKARVLTPTVAISVKALASFTDRFEKPRLIGEEWLVTNDMCVTFIPSPEETVTQEVKLMTLSARQYVVVLDPVDATGKPRLGQRELRKGPATFFLRPGERALDGRVKDIHVLKADEALVVTAIDVLKDGARDRAAGEKWMIRGPCDYIPPIQVKVVETRKAIPLDVTEGVYIRDLSTGRVRSHMGSTVLLTENEQLFQKRLDPQVEELLSCTRYSKTVKDAPTPSVKRDASRVVNINVPHNTVVQVYDYSRKVARVHRGPELVSLGSDEDFTVVSLSGNRPKESDFIKTLCVNLGPDFMTDVIVVETADHARLSLHLSYNWHFEVAPGQESKVFSVPDFIGDACKMIASRIRGAVAGESFDKFHKHSATIIRHAVFGSDSKVVVEANGLVIDNVDIHSVDPVDPKTREALTKSVQLAIEITTKSQEATARQTASVLEQEACGRLERQIILDRVTAESERKKLLEIEAENAAVECTGSSKAQALAQRDAKLIEGNTEVELATKQSQAREIMFNAEMEVLIMKQDLQVAHKKGIYELEIHRARTLAAIETNKFRKVLSAVKKDTIKALARAGPELQIRLLKALGLQGYLVTDGTSPINLFNTAKGMASSAAAPPGAAPRPATA